MEHHRDVLKTTIMMEALKGALLVMQNEGKVDLNEVNRYFRDALGNLNAIQLFDMARSTGFSFAQAGEAAGTLLEPDYQLFKPLDLGGVDNG